MPIAFPRFVVTLFAWLFVGLAQHAAAQQPALNCDVGPISRTFGATPWLVYACSDGKSVVAVTEPNSPAAPFYFMLFPKEGKYAVVGEGTGPKSVTDRAYSELLRLTEHDVAALIAAAKKK